MVNINPKRPNCKYPDKAASTAYKKGCRCGECKKERQRSDSKVIKRKHIKNCLHCGKEYTTTEKNQKYCSCECANTVNGILKRKIIKLNCPICNKEFTRKAYERRRGGKYQKNLYCSRKCHALSQRDEYTPFVWFMRTVRARMRLKGISSDLMDFDKKDLKELWDIQGGMCALSGVRMILDPTTGKSRATKRMPKNPYKASLDRIDSNKPYTKDNIQFVCMAMNYMKNEFGNDEIIEFINTTRNSSQIDAVS